MADIVTGTVTGQLDTTDLLRDHSDIRQEIADEGRTTVDAVKTAAWHNSDRTGTEADRVVGQSTAYFIAQQQNDFTNATALAAMKAGVDMQFANTLNAINTQGGLGQAATALEGAKTAAAVALAGEKQAAAAALGQALIQQAIVADGSATRALINGQHIDTLNRLMAERNAEIVENRDRCRYYEGQFVNAQQANLVSQINALNSQFQETRQGMVNFGTMSGAAGQQTSTSNNVR